jgi:hypothetical protein
MGWRYREPMLGTLGRDRFAAVRLAWGAVLVVTGVAGLSGALLIAAALLDRTLTPGDALRFTLTGFGLLLVLVLTAAARARWYENHAIYRSWRDLMEAVHASLGRVPLFRDELEELRRFALERDLADAPLKALYETAQRRRRDGADAEQEFRWLANLVFRFVTNVHHVSAHTSLASFTPRGYRAGYVIAGGFICSGLGLLAVGAIGLWGGESRVALAAGGLWSMCVGTGLWRRWRWGWWQAFAFLVLAEASLIWAAARHLLQDPAWGVALSVPLVLGLYLFRHRRWFTER